MHMERPGVMPVGLEDHQSCVCVCVCVCTEWESFRYYAEGVYSEPKCRTESTKLDHAVVLAGYGTTDDGRGHAHTHTHARAHTHTHTG